MPNNQTPQDEMSTDAMINILQRTRQRLSELAYCRLTDNPKFTRDPKHMTTIWLVRTKTLITRAIDEVLKTQE